MVSQFWQHPLENRRKQSKYYERVSSFLYIYITAFIADKSYYFELLNFCRQVWQESATKSAIEVVQVSLAIAHIPNVCIRFNITKCHWFCSVWLFSYRSEVKARQDVKPDIRQPFTDYRQPPVDYRHPPVADYRQPPTLDYRHPPLLDYRQLSTDPRTFPLPDYRMPQVALLPLCIHSNTGVEMHTDIIIHHWNAMWHWQFISMKYVLCMSIKCP